MRPRKRAKVELSADDTITYSYDDNDRLIDEVADKPGTADDTNTVYTYDNTVETGKTVRAGTTVGSGTVIEQHTFGYNVLGRLEFATIDKTGAGGGVTTETYTYNIDGLRVTTTVGGTTTTYLFDTLNPTGFAQVLEEGVDTDSDGLEAGEVVKTYTLGLDVIAHADATNGLLTLLYDAHGSTRLLLDNGGLVISGQVVTYDAYGNAVGFDLNASLTTLLYSGEWTHIATGKQYLRARFIEALTGRFNRLDPFFGHLDDPQSLHKYLYTHNDPINNLDPSGEVLVVEVLETQKLRTQLRASQARP